MIKKVFAVLIFVLNFSAFACQPALPRDNINFCSSFPTAATCYCMALGAPAAWCQDMNKIYQSMILFYGSLPAACQRQHFTTPEDCVNNWTCYMFGGTDSNGILCSSTGRSCQ